MAFKNFSSWLGMIALCSILNSSALLAQLHVDWSLSQGSKESDFTGSFVQDDQGHLYSMSFFTDTTDLDPGAGEEILVPWYEETTVITTLSTDGSYLWSGVFHTKGENGGALTEVKNNQMVMYILYLDTLVYIREGSAPISVSSNPGPHTCVITMDLEGNITYFKDVNDGDDLYFSTLTTHPGGQVLASGGFRNPLTFPTANGDTTFIPVGNSDGFIASVDAYWNLQWIQIFGSDDYDYIENLSVANGKIYYALVYEDTLTVNTVNGPATFYSNGEENALFGTLELDGTNLTAQSFGSDGYDEIRGIQSDSEGNIYVCGFFEGTVNFEHPDLPPVVFSSVAEGDGFVSKYYPDGALAWTRIFTTTDYGGVYTLNLQRDNSLYFSGGYAGIADLDPGPDSIIVENEGIGNDVFIAKFQTDGEMNWVYNFEGNQFEGIRNFFPSPDARVFVHGFYFDELDSDFGPDTNLLISEGGSDVFMFGLTEEGVVTATKQQPKSNFQLYPNPSHDQVTISCDTPIEYVRIYSIDGTPMFIQNGNDSNILQLNLNRLSPGSYLVSVKTADSFVTKQVVKME